MDHHLLPSVFCQQCFSSSDSVDNIIPFPGDGLQHIPKHRMCIINMALSDEAIINFLLHETMKVERKEFEGQKRSNENDIIRHRQKLAAEHVSWDYFSFLQIFQFKIYPDGKSLSVVKGDLTSFHHCFAPSPPHTHKEKPIFDFFYPKNSQKIRILHPCVTPTCCL